MKKLFSLVAIFAFALIFSQNHPVTASKITWKAYKSLKADAFSHNGTVQLKAGNFTVNAANEVIGGNFIIDMNTIFSEDEQGKMKDMLERHLKSDDFFDVKKFPTVFFKLTSVKKSSDKKFNSVVGGNLTIKGITKSVSFPANIIATKSGITLDSSVFTFNRHDFDLRYDTFEDMAISNDVEMQVHAAAK